MKYFNDNFSDIRHQYETEFILTEILSNNTSRHAGSFFCLPATFLIGFPKSGTTQLYKYIVQHPLIEQPRDKEGQFWRELICSDQYKELHVLFHFLMLQREPNKSYY